MSLFTSKSLIYSNKCKWGQYFVSFTYVWYENSIVWSLNCPLPFSWCTCMFSLENLCLWLALLFYYNCLHSALLSLTSWATAYSHGQRKEQLWEFVRHTESKHGLCLGLTLLLHRVLAMTSWFTRKHWKTGLNLAVGFSKIMSHSHVFTLDTLILAIKKLSLSGKLANFILATLVFLHYSMYKNRVKLATFKISYLN